MSTIQQTIEISGTGEMRLPERLRALIAIEPRMDLMNAGEVYSNTAPIGPYLDADDRDLDRRLRQELEAAMRVAERFETLDVTQPISVYEIAPYVRKAIESERDALNDVGIDDLVTRAPALAELAALADRVEAWVRDHEEAA